MKHLNIPEARAIGWVNADEAIPSNSRSVIIYGVDEVIGGGLSIDCFDHEFGDGGMWGGRFDVTAWHELPEFPNRCIQCWREDCEGCGV